MSLGSLDRFRPCTDNCAMAEVTKTWVRAAAGLLILLSLVALSGCSGVSSAANTTTPPSSNPPSGNPPPTQGTLAVSPANLSFGNVVIGSSAVQSGTLTAGSADVTVSSASWNGEGYSLSGITFPVTVPAGSSVHYDVTFAPSAAGSSSGSVSFVSNASNTPASQTFSGTGGQASSHTVALSWTPSTSTVVGYNVYRGTTSGGPYVKVTSTTTPGPTYTDNEVSSGTTYYYVATSVDNNGTESTYSNQAVAAIP